MAIDKIGSAAITDCTVVAADIAPGTVTNAKLAGSIANAKLANSSVTVNGISLSLGASGSIPAVSWQAVVTSDGSTVTTMVAGRGYFIDNTSAAGLVSLPSSASAGDTISIKDYGANFGTNNLTIQRNGHNIQGVANDSTLTTNRASVTLVYVDATKGWLYSNESNPGAFNPQFIAATGGTVTESGDFKIHTFTGDGCFVVSSLGGGSTPSDISNKVSYIVVAGGAGGGTAAAAGGGGAGGFREGIVSAPDYTASPLATTGLTVTASTFPITVGAGGVGAGNSRPEGFDNTAGSTSTFSTISSAGGGKGGGFPSQNGVAGGSGGGGANGPNGTSGAGNTPPVSPPQGNAGGAAHPTTGSGAGGGGATQIGQPKPTDHGGAGGAGATTGINGSNTTFAGGGGGSGSQNGGCAGAGGGGAGSNEPPSPPKPIDKAENGTANTGGGGGALRCAPIPSAYTAPGGGSGAGGKGIVIIRYKFQ
jgi:hypothetical protein